MSTLYKIRLRKGYKRDSNEVIGKIRAGQVRAVTKEQRDAIMGTTNSSPRHLAKWYEDCGTMEIADEPEPKPEPIVPEKVEEVPTEVVAKEDVPEELEEGPAEDVEVKSFEEPEPEKKPKPRKSRKTGKRSNKKSTK